MPEDAEVIRTSVARIDEARKDAERRGRPKTKDMLARERVKQGQVLPPLHMQGRDRLRTRTIGQCRESMTSVTNAVAGGALDVDVGMNLIKMIKAIVETLKAEREDDLVRASLDRLDTAVQKLEAAGLGDIVDMGQIRASLLEQRDD